MKQLFFMARRVDEVLYDRFPAEKWRETETTVETTKTRGDR